MKSASFAPESLVGRVEAVLKPQVGRLIDLFNRLVVVAGNGLTRIAAGVSGTAFSGLSWEAWVANACEAAGMVQNARYLRLRGYDLPSMFQEAVSFVLRGIELARYAEDSQPPTLDPDVLTKLWSIYEPLKTLYRISPSPAHEAIGHFADFVITTNYDNIFDRLPGWQCDERIGPKKPGPTPQSKTKLVQHIHGYFPPDERVFESWVKNLGMRTTLAERSMYTEWTYEKTDEDVRKSFGPVLEELADSGNLVIFLGLSLGAEEMFLERLLRLGRANVNPARLATLHVGPPLDPLLYLKSRRIRILTVPDGLVSGAHGRALAILILLRLLVDKWKSSGTNQVSSDRLARAIKEHLRDLKQVSWPRNAVTNTPLPDTTPIVGAVGQVSMNRIVGIEQTPSQERAYQPTESTWKPGASERSALLCWDAGGQAFVPCLVWDALRIPCSLSGVFYDDEVGEQILGWLGRTNWLDYLGVVQCPTGQELKGSAAATENSTVVTWFGQRLIIDSARRPDHKSDLERYLSRVQRLSTADQGRYSHIVQVLTKWPSNIALTPPVVYATKPDWDATRRGVLEQKQINSSWDPLIVFDTGGVGNPEAELWVASQRGIIIASAFTALIWYRAAKCFAAINGPTRPLHLDEEALRQFLNCWQEVKNKCEEEGPKDERGRAWQLTRLLGEVQNQGQRVPYFLAKGPLSNLRAFIVTLGELGCLYWLPQEDGWIRSVPRWSALVGARDVYAGPVPDREVVSGFGCGDVARAGFVAALLAQAHGKLSPLSLDNQMLEWAIGWANWFGAKKVRFLALQDFLQFLRWEPGSDPPKTRDLVKPMAARPDFNESARLEDEELFWTDALSSDGSLDPVLQSCVTNLLELQQADRKAWEDRMKSWRAARFSDFKF